MYISATQLVNLGLPKTFIQLFHMQVHITYIQAWYDVLFQIRFCNFSANPQSNNLFQSYSMYNLKDRKPDEQSQQCDSM